MYLYIYTYICISFVHSMQIFPPIIQYSYYWFKSRIKAWMVIGSHKWHRICVCMPRVEPRIFSPLHIIYVHIYIHTHEQKVNNFFIIDICFMIGKMIRENILILLRFHFFLSLFFFVVVVFVALHYCCCCCCCCHCRQYGQNSSSCFWNWYAWPKGNYAMHTQALQS